MGNNSLLVEKLKINGDLFQKPRYEETEAAIDDFRFLVLSFGTDQRTVIYGLLRLIGVGAGADSTYYAADGYCAASAVFACADAVGSTISHCSSHFGYA